MLIFVILWFFEPFELYKVQKFKIVIFIGYGLITYFSLFINFNLIPKIFPKIFKKHKWTIIKEIIFLIWIVFFIAINNFYYTVYWANMSGSLNRFYDMIIYTGKVGIFPVIVYILLKQIIMKKRKTISTNNKNNPDNQKENNTPDINNSKVYFKFKNNNNYLSVDMSELQFVLSRGNYMEINLFNGEIKNMLIRKSLNSIEYELQKFKKIFRCHRSYLVNLNSIEKVTGNSQGLILLLKYSNKKIPVARSRIKEFRKRYNYRYSS